MKPFKPQTKQYWRIVLLCFVAASTFWLLNALNKSYSTQTTYPIRFVYNSEQLVPLKPLPEEVMVNVTAKGWKLLRKTLRLEVSPAEIYIRNMPRNSYLLGSALRPALVNAMDGLQLNFVVTDTLSFFFDEKVNRTFSLALDQRQKLTAAGFEVAGPVKLDPDSVTFTGPLSILRKYSNPFIVKLPSADLSVTSTIEVPITVKTEEQELVTANINETEVTIPVKNLVQEERQLMPEMVNVPAGNIVLLRPASIKVQYQLFEDSAALLNRESFKAILNYANFNPQDSTITPELIQKPVGVRNVRLTPQRVKVILQEQP